MKKSHRLNFKHLRYFFEIARSGSVTAAAKRLHVAPQTVSSQLRELEQSCGQLLFDRSGKRLTLTTAGQIAQDYASTIFALGEELSSVLVDAAQPRRQTFRVGTTDSIPKILTIAALEPILAKCRDSIELVCVEGPVSHLVGKASARELDVVIADTPAPPTLARSLQSRLLLSSGVSFMCARSILPRRKLKFPECLDGMAFLAGSSHASPLAQAVDVWLQQRNLAVRIAGRFDDSALMKGFAQRGLGVIVVPTSIETQVANQYALATIGRTDEVLQSIYLIRPRRHRPHVLVTEIERQFSMKPAESNRNA